MSNEKPIEEVAEKVAVKSDKKLRKALSFQDLFFLSMGGIIGSGWLLGVAAGASLAGPGAILSWVVGGIIVLFIALVFAEIAGAIPKSGSIVRYSHLANGGYAGYILGWAYLLSAVTVPTIEAEAVLQYASTYIPGLFTPAAVLSAEGIGLGIVLMVLFFFLNYAGIRFLGKFNSGATWWKFVIPTTTFILLLFLWRGNNFTGYGGFFPEGLNAVFYAIPAGGIVFSYLGFRQALEFGGEAKNPQRDIPRATVYSVIAAMVLYTMLQVAFIGAIRWGGASGVAPGAWTSISTSALGSAPFYMELHNAPFAALVAFAYLLLIDAWISPAGTGWIYLGNGTRVMYGIGADGYFPKAFLRISEKTKVPIVALIASLVVGIIFFLPFPSWYLFVGFISSATVLTYVIGPIALHTFRKHAPEIKRPFRLPAASVVAPIGFVGAALIVYWTGLSTLTIIFGTVFIGVSLFYFSYAPTKIGLSKGISYALGIFILIVSVFALFFAYYYVLYPSGTQTLAVNARNFAIAYVLDFIAIVVTTLITHSITKQEHKVLFKSSYWLLALIFITYLFSYIGSFGYTTIPALGGPKPIIPFPEDTIVMIVIYAIIYIFGLRAGYKTEDLQAIIDEQVSPPSEAPEQV